MNVTRIAHMDQVVDSKEWNKTKRKGGDVEFNKVIFKRGLSSKEGKGRLWSGWEAKKKKKETKRNSRGVGVYVCDRRSSRHRMRGRAEKESRERCVVVKGQGKERRGRGNVEEYKGASQPD